MKKWFISGVSSGLGQALAKYVLASGDYVIGTVRQTEQAVAFNEQAEGRGEAVVLDIRDSQRVSQIVSGLYEMHKTIDVLVNNAGIGFIGAIEEASEDELREVMEVNVFAVHHMLRQFLPHMRKAAKGHIVQVSSHSGFRAMAGFGIYNTSKFALEGMSEALAHELAPLGIQVLIVEPGPFRTAFAGSSLREAECQIADYHKTAGTFRERLRGVDGKQEGDPEKAAVAIYNAVNQPDAPLRLPLGKIAVQSLEAKLESVRQDLNRNRDVAENAVFR